MKSILTITALNTKIKQQLGENFSGIWVQGEISGLVRASSGHCYFSLKDSRSQVRCVMFRGNQPTNQSLLTQGNEVLIYASASLYEVRGDLQLLVHRVELSGEGLLRQQFEQLRQKLQTQGWFDEQYKKAWGELPEKIGVITSERGAALQDVLKVLARRSPWVEVKLYPTLVQGQEAPVQIVQAIELANQSNCDVLILTRGGGDIADLQAFNNEKVAAAIFHSKLPIISGVGHEVDITIADLVADCRAATPTAAAEQASLDKQHVRSRLDYLLHRLQQSMLNKIQESMQQLDRLESELLQLKEQWVTAKLQQLTNYHTRLYLQHPKRKIQQQLSDLSALQIRLEHLLEKKLIGCQYRVQQVANSLNQLSPLNTLSRGFSVVTNQQQVIMTSAEQAQVGDDISIRLKKGQLDCKVIKTICS